jgi:hypothetical protein
MVNYNIKLYNIMMYKLVDPIYFWDPKIPLFSRILYDLFHHPSISSIKQLFLREISLIY